MPGLISLFEISHYLLDLRTQLCSREVVKISATASFHKLKTAQERRRGSDELVRDNALDIFWKRLTIFRETPGTPAPFRWVSDADAQEHDPGAAEMDAASFATWLGRVGWYEFSKFLAYSFEKGQPLLLYCSVSY